MDAAQRESRNYQTEVYKIRTSYEESIEQLEIVKRENKNLTDEISDLTDQLTTGGKSLHELSKAKKKAELEAEELRAALEEAEGALELEEVGLVKAEQISPILYKQVCGKLLFFQYRAACSAFNLS